MEIRRRDEKHTHTQIGNKQEVKSSRVKVCNGKLLFICDQEMKSKYINQDANKNIFVCGFICGRNVQSFNKKITKRLKSTVQKKLILQRV